MKMIALRRDWYRCPHCGKNLVIYDNTANCSGVFMKCKNCRQEVEIKLTSKTHPLVEAVETD